MLRDKNLIPLSHQHQHALALCVRIDRASPVPESDLESWQSEIVQIVRGEIAIHFAAEEQVLFPAAERFEQLRPLVKDLLADHLELRRSFALAERREMSPADLAAFAQRLSAHIRREERELFEQLQKLMKEEELSEVGRQLEAALQDSNHSCILPTDATRLRAAK